MEKRNQTMTRIFPILAAAATVAFLAFSIGEASAAAVGARGGQPGGPSGPSGPTGSSGSSYEWYVHGGCDNHVDISGLSGGERRDYLKRCPSPNHDL
jgi:hypothetical protein